MTRLLYTSPSGKTLDLASPGDWQRSVAESGLRGLVGTKTATTLSGVGRPGDVPVAFRTEPMTGELHLEVVDGERSISDLVSELHREFKPDQVGVLRIVDRQLAPDVWTHVRLAGPIAAPHVFLDAGATDAEVTIPLVSDRGLWSTPPFSDEGEVTIINDGDEFIWPSLAIFPNAKLTLPSGRQVLLPAFDGAYREVSLDPSTGHEVTDEAGIRDESMSEIFAGMWIGEGVPQSQQRTYIVDNAMLSWSIDYLDPWR